MIDALQGTEYTKLGIDPALVTALDKTNNGRVTEDDAIDITRELIKDENMLNEYQVAYFFNFIKTQWNDGAKKRVGKSLNENTDEWTSGVI